VVGIDLRVTCQRYNKTTDVSNRRGPLRRRCGVANDPKTQSTLPAITGSLNFVTVKECWPGHNSLPSTRLVECRFSYGLHNETDEMPVQWIWLKQHSSLYMRDAGNAVWQTFKR